MTGDDGTVSRPSQCSRSSRSLAGEWGFALDPDDVGVDERWFESSLGDVISLPGTTDEAEKGAPNPTREPDHLTRRHPYEGAAWYQRTVTISDEWATKRVVLTLERTRSTRLWVDGDPVGRRDSLSTPQEYDLPAALDAGEHVLTVRVDNTSSVLSLPGVQRSHAATEHTQTNWNGVVGDVRLDATSPVWVDDVQVVPDPDRGAAAVTVSVGNRTETAVSGRLSLSVRAASGDRESAFPAETAEFSVGAESGAPRSEPTSPPTAPPASTTVTATFDLGDELRRWDEFSPETYALDVELDATTEAESGDEESLTDAVSTTFGVCEFEARGTKFVVNGRTTFLRGNVDCCIFPRTGYPPTSRSAWREVFETAAEYGINHYRFHSWCPPRAAFEAADELGVYLQPELPLWNSETAFEDRAARAFYRAEAKRILDAYGDHPSFVMFALGNELCGDRDAMDELVEHCREHDPRPLYATGSYNFLSESTVTETDDYWTTASVPSPDGAAGDRSRVRAAALNERPPSTTRNYEHLVADLPMPVVSHEIGQYQFYPDFGELPKYDGVLAARNLELARDHLEAHRMLDRAAEFAHASGQLALRCYREDAEAALRTPSLGGFHLLALQDFPGQGTALVGVLDSFMDSKGVVDPEAWRRFCAPTVALVEMPSRTWEADETLAATVRLAHYGPTRLAGVAAEWTLKNDEGVVTSGRTDQTDVPQGTVTALGRVDVDLAVDAPAALELVVDVVADGVDGSVATNRYSAWAYPDDAPEPAACDDDVGETSVVVRRTFDEATRNLLTDGADVLLVPKREDLAHAVDGTFRTDFWSYALFKRRAPPGTMGPALDPTHPLFEAFPTADHGDWQWWHLLKRSHPVVLDDAPAEYEPLVRMVDNIERNQRLGLVFETAVGDGGLLVCAADLFAAAAEPSVRQFYDALRTYAASDAFDPDEHLTGEVLRKLLAP
ncbi:glycoside hydrolase [Halogeometricum sp. S1BR25-6]|uniref:beta-galactosidase n=1 Tax=Halogeometricum salsisoli TaxID=2950536 RepID=A0ABU2GIK7_9EURY|nr:sugar-binding domain-containing protein [Halogeometricum sp. S1BR25-6]MDS0300646.1 glycoside hydrolase [Halogeometricum sp. S1BR25-6]